MKPSEARRDAFLQHVNGEGEGGNANTYTYKTISKLKIADGNQTSGFTI